jgi:aminoglycoside phosphotransferase (APT) family kinase protein
LQGKAARVSEVTGFVPQIGAIAYRAAAGRPFDVVLPALTDTALVRSTQLMLGGLAALWKCDLPGQDRMDSADYLRRAERSAKIIATADQDSGQSALAILQQAAVASPALRHRPIHGDMKLDHAFLDGEAVTLIDTESVKLGDPDYDLALLDARLVLHQLQGSLTPTQCATIQSVIRQSAGPHYEWFHQLARLHAAKFLAQRESPLRAEHMRQMLA